MKMIFLSLKSGNRKDGSIWYQGSFWGRMADGNMATREYWLPDKVGARLARMSIENPISVDIECGLDEKLFPAITNVRLLEDEVPTIFDLSEGGARE